MTPSTLDVKEDLNFSCKQYLYFANVEFHIVDVPIKYCLKCVKKIVVELEYKTILQTCFAQ